MRTKMKYALALCGVGFMAFVVLTQARAADRAVARDSAENDAKVELTEDGIIQIRHTGQGVVFMGQDGLGVIVDFPSGKGIAYIFEDFELLKSYYALHRPAVASALNGLDDVGLDADVFYEDARFEGEVTLLQVGDGDELSIEIVLAEPTDDFDRGETVSWTVQFLMPEIIRSEEVNDWSNGPLLGGSPNTDDCPGGICSCSEFQFACCPAGRTPVCDCGNPPRTRCVRVTKRRHLRAIEFEGGHEQNGP